VSRCRSRTPIRLPTWSRQCARTPVRDRTSHRLLNLVTSFCHPERCERQFRRSRWSGCRRSVRSVHSVNADAHRGDWRRPDRHEERHRFCSKSGINANSPSRGPRRTQNGRRSHGQAFPFTR
jgi:hypothetical protein